MFGKLEKQSPVAWCFLEADTPKSQIDSDFNVDVCVLIVFILH